MCATSVPPTYYNYTVQSITKDLIFFPVDDVGYGNIAPRTILGKMVTIIYAMVGMPLFLLYVSNMGDFLATCFRWGYVKLCKCNCLGRPAGHQQRGSRRRVSQRSTARLAYNQHQQQQELLAAGAYDPVTNSISIHHRRVGGFDPVVGPGSTGGPLDPSTIHQVVAVHHQQIQQQSQQANQADYQTATVPITISLAVMVSYVVGGAVLFKQWETDWDYLDGSYFCFISLSTTGFGDLVPGDKINSSSGVELSLIFCSMYLIIGMALIAMCFNLMQEEVIAKVRKLGQVLGCIKPGDD